MQARGGCLFHSSPGIRVKSRHLFDQTSLKFVVCWIFLFYCYWKTQAKAKGWERKVPVILCCEILHQFLADCDRSKRAKGKATWFSCLCQYVDCNVAICKSQTLTKDWFFFSIIIECDMKFTSSVEKISYKWALYGCKTLKTSQRVRNAYVFLHLSVISDSVEEQTDFSCFLSTVVLLNRPRSH